MKKIFTLFAALAMVMSMSAAKLYLTPNANWNQSNARFAAYFFGNGEKWISMTKVTGETNLYEVEAPAGFPNVIFCRMNPNATANNWNNKWNQTGDLAIPADGKNHFTVPNGSWDGAKTTWSIWPIPAEKNYVDVTITVTANAPASIKWANAGDKLADATDYVAMTAGENNTYTYTLAQVDDFSGVKYTIKVGEIEGAAQQTSVDVTADFKDLLPQVVLRGVNDNASWDGHKMIVSDDYLSASITQTLAATNHEIKITVDNEWFGSNKITITRDNNSAIFAENGDGNGKLTADLAGDYVFTYTYANKTLTVTYPEAGTTPDPETPVEPEEPETITYVLMGVGGDWTTGIELTLNETQTDYVEYKLLGQTISEGDAVKVVTIINGEQKAWCGNVEEGCPVERTFDDMGNIVLAPGKYDFYYKVTENIIYIGATPSEEPVEPEEPVYEIYEQAITNLVIDFDNLILTGGPSEEFLVTVTLGLGEYDMTEGIFQLLPESEISVQGYDATFVEGWASVDGIANTAEAVVRCLWNDMALEFHLSMSAAPLEATVVVVENANVAIEKVLLFGDMYDYALKMTGIWTNEGVDYPVLVEVPVYYPEATEPSEITSTVTVGDLEDENGPWLGFGEGTLTITTIDGVVTATGVVTNQGAGIAIDITISGTVPQGPTGVENLNGTVAPVKMIENGQIFIIRNGVKYNAQGAQL